MAFAHQVGGHADTILASPLSSSTLIKPASERELAFYQSLGPSLAGGDFVQRWTPAFYGTLKAHAPPAPAAAAAPAAPAATRAPPDVRPRLVIQLAPRNAYRCADASIWLDARTREPHPPLPEAKRPRHQTRNSAVRRGRVRREEGAHAESLRGEHERYHRDQAHRLPSKAILFPLIEPADVLPQAGRAH
jgi:hypothetical protein